MKTLATIILISIATVAFAQEEKELKRMTAKKISQSEVPGPIITQFQKDFPNLSPFQFYAVGDTTLTSEWEISNVVSFDKGDKIDHYAIEMEGNDTKIEALYDQKGKLILSKELQKNYPLPKPVAESLQKDYSGLTVVSDEHYKVKHYDKRAWKEYYEVTLSNGSKVVYAGDGTELKKKKK